ncbi:MAG: histidine kinase [Bacteroidales bacterium]|nr:histidine kinase [Bacteroidales bacterium]
MQYSVFKKSWIIHFLIWTSYYVLLLWFYSEIYSDKLALINSSVILLVQVFVFYLNYFVLLPRYFEKKLFYHYGILVLLLVIFILFFFNWFVQLEYIRDLRVNFRRSSGIISDFRNQAADLDLEKPPFGLKLKLIHRHVLFNGFFVAAVLFISTIYRNLVVGRIRENEALKLKSQMMEAESKMLKWQINPHFLFNTLNNIYSMAQMKSDKTPEAVHKISGMLRYVIYECNKDRVKLGQELNYIKSFIELQLLKDENISNVKYNFDHVNHNLNIAPLLLITFIENSFKHSKVEDEGNSWITMEMNTNGIQLNFQIENSIPSTHETKDATAGIGLENVKRRLKLVYPGRHILNLGVHEGVYSVRLTIDLDGD